jgi:hypothetical protein
MPTHGTEENETEEELRQEACCRKVGEEARHQNGGCKEARQKGGCKEDGCKEACCKSQRRSALRLRVGRPKKAQTTSRVSRTSRSAQTSETSRTGPAPSVKAPAQAGKSRPKATRPGSTKENAKPASTGRRNRVGTNGKAAPPLAFAEALAGLRSLLEPYVDRLEVVIDSPDSLMLNCTKPHHLTGKPLFFAGVTHRRSYVSFYLMPIYVFPELNHGVSPALAARKQGKSCFNFTTRDDLLFAELRKLTERSFKHFAKKGLL